MSEPVVETVYWLSDFCDEVCPHDTTLEGAAYYLQHGRRADETEADVLEQDDEWRSRFPAAKPGDTVPLSVLELFGNRTVTFEDGKLDLSPPVPDDADFFVPRHGPRGGWWADAICFDLTTLFEQLHEGDARGGVQIAVGRTREANAIFQIGEDGTPELLLVKSGGLGMIRAAILALALAASAGAQGLPTVGDCDGQPYVLRELGPLEGARTRATAVIDGDSFCLGLIEIRVADVDAPEKRAAGGAGVESLATLRRLLWALPVTCRTRDDGGAPSSFDRVVAFCRIGWPPGDFDLSETLVALGAAERWEEGK